MEADQHYPKRPIRYIVLSGGGINGFAHVGAWGALEIEWRSRGRHLYTSIEGVAGTSVGAIVGLGMLLGYTAVEFERFAVTVLEDSQEHAKLNVLAACDGKGMISNDLISNFVKKLISSKLDNENVTFAELEEYFGGKRFVCTAHNFTTLAGELLGSETTPDLEVWRGVTMSCLLPFIFDSMWWKDGEYVDGGLSNALPTNVFPPEDTLALYICRKPGKSHPNFFNRFARVVEAYETCVKDRLLLTPTLSALVRIHVSVNTSEHVMKSGGMYVDEVARKQQMAQGESAVYAQLRPEWWTLICRVLDILHMRDE
jgi:predicted acylesterase/phospholipase RssA